MSNNPDKIGVETVHQCDCGCSHGPPPPSPKARIPSLGADSCKEVGCGAATAALTGMNVSAAEAEDKMLIPPPPKPLRGKPILTYQIQPRQDRHSYREYG